MSLQAGRSVLPRLKKLSGKGLTELLGSVRERSKENLLRTSDGTLLDEDGSAGLLAATFFTPDCEDKDAPDQAELRSTVKMNRETMRRDSSITEVIVPFTRLEIESVFDRMSPKKAPKGDGITSDIYVMRPIRHVRNSNWAVKAD